MKDYPENYEEKYALTFEEKNEFLERISLKPLIERYLPLLAILLYTGIRISEALGLTWDNVDFQRRTITINHQLQYRKSNGKMRLYCVDTRKNEQKNTIRTSRVTSLS